MVTSLRSLGTEGLFGFLRSLGTERPCDILGHLMDNDGYRVLCAFFIFAVYNGRPLEQGHMTTIQFLKTV